MIREYPRLKGTEMKQSQKEAQRGIHKNARPKIARQPMPGDPSYNRK